VVQVPQRVEVGPPRLDAELEAQRQAPHQKLAAITM
jgi:hypothetical protein